MLIQVMAICACTVSASFGQAPKEVGAFLIQTTPAEMAKEFQQNFAAAAKKYNPNVPKGVMGGAIVELKGQVSGFGQTLLLFTKTGGLEIVVLTDQMPNDKSGTYAVDVTGKFDGFRNGRLYIKADKVEYHRVVFEK